MTFNVPPLGDINWPPLRLWAKQAAEKGGLQTGGDLLEEEPFFGFVWGDACAIRINRVEGVLCLQRVLAKHHY